MPVRNKLSILDPDIIADLSINRDAIAERIAIENSINVAHDTLLTRRPYSYSIGSTFVLLDSKGPISCIIVNGKQHRF